MAKQPLNHKHLKLSLAFTRNTYLGCKDSAKRAYWRRVLRCLVLKQLRDTTDQCLADGVNDLFVMGKLGDVCSRLEKGLPEFEGCITYTEEEEIFRFRAMSRQQTS